MSCPQIWDIEKDKDREKETTGRQASELQREKELEPERKKTKGDIFCCRKNMTFCSDGMLVATRVKMSDSEKKVNKNTSDMPSIKRVTRKFPNVSRCSIFNVKLTFSKSTTITTIVRLKARV